MEMLGLNPDFWRGRPVFLTGHTGFKGGWLAQWLCDLGAKVYGYSLSLDDDKFFTEARVEDRVETSSVGTYLTCHIAKALKASNADIVFHLAAQPLFEILQRTHSDINC